METRQAYFTAQGEGPFWSKAECAVAEAERFLRASLQYEGMDVTKTLAFIDKCPNEIIAYLTAIDTVDDLTRP